MRGVAGYLRRGLPAAVYARGGFGLGEPVLGRSDIDLVAIVCEVSSGSDAWSRLVSRWERLERVLPWLRRVAYLECYSEPEVQESRWTRFTYGLDGRTPRSLLFGDSPRSWSEPGRRSLPLLLPDLWPLESWRLILGPDLRPAPDTAVPAMSRHLVAWVHLQYWWRVGLRALTEPSGRWISYAAVKLVAEPAKILLWLERGERHFARREILERAREVLPDEEATIAFVLGLLGDLDHARSAPIEAVWPCFVRLTGRIADRLLAELEPLGTTAVRLAGAAPLEVADGGSRAWPLADWTALVWPPGREESFVAGSAAADELPAVLAAAEASTATRFLTVLHGGVFVRPGRHGREWFRAVDFDATDPVSTAQLSGQSVACFPNAAGWSALDTASRAVAEHAAWLALPRSRTAESSGALSAHLAGLFSAARAALFLNSIHDGDPALCLTFGTTAAAWAERLPGYRGAIEDAYERYGTTVSGSGGADRGVLRAGVGALAELGCYETPFPHLFPGQRSRPASTREVVAGT